MRGACWPRSRSRSRYSGAGRRATPAGSPCGQASGAGGLARTAHRHAVPALDELPGALRHRPRHNRSLRPVGQDGHRSWVGPGVHRRPRLEARGFRDGHNSRTAPAPSGHRWAARPTGPPSTAELSTTGEHARPGPRSSMSIRPPNSTDHRPSSPSVCRRAARLGMLSAETVGVAVPKRQHRVRR